MGLFSTRGRLGAGHAARDLPERLTATARAAINDPRVVLVLLVLAALALAAEMAASFHVI
jgi:membrane-bound ClpP family serine protease